MSEKWTRHPPTPEERKDNELKIKRNERLEKYFEEKMEEEPREPTPRLRKMSATGISSMGNTAAISNDDGSAPPAVPTIPATPIVSADPATPAPPPASTDVVPPVPPATSTDPTTLPT